MGDSYANVGTSSSSARRPVLLLLLYGAILVTVGITASSQAGIVSSRYATAALEAVVDGDAAAIRSLVDEDLEAADLIGGGPSAGRVLEIEAALGRLVETTGMLHAEIRTPTGTIVAGSSPGMAGQEPDDGPGAGGEGQAAFVAARESGAGSGASIEALPVDQALLRELMPLAFGDGRVAGMIAVWRDADPIVAEMDAVRREVVILTLSGAIVIGILLTLIFRAAQRRLTHQTQALVEAAKLDALTGMPNHGTLVTALAERIETARITGAILGVAIVDIDNFRALNDTQGHAVGDEALLQVKESLGTLGRPGSIVGRYGPDEFLVIVGAADAALLEADLDGVRRALAELEMIVPDADPLPLTVSAGIATFPVDGDSATSLLAAAASAANVAASSGGNAVRVADVDHQSAVGAATFDVFQGLVLAINTKDRYTKRHSEDVARYAVFLARQLGLDEAFVETLRVAGLLHDVGKIGIPDPILRKPGRLTAAEFAVLKQHVTLGDAIVRDLPDIDVIRAGIRHHHERWDGRGYAAGLDGDSIPLVARILAIGDAFSAMTTSRPYRKSIGVREAIRRLGDAAGSQLDERLVSAFILGMETAPDAPIPGDEAVGMLWTPAVRVA